MYLQSIHNSLNKQIEDLKTVQRGLEHFEFLVETHLNGSEMPSQENRIKIYKTFKELYRILESDVHNLTTLTDYFSERTKVLQLNELFKEEASGYPDLEALETNEDDIIEDDEDLLCQFDRAMSKPIEKDEPPSFGIHLTY